jgi:UDP-GlcNAc:undecaprenyl-phosphate/decaprenyl-phosphate GlcNAc-1-phosphate transferase
MLSLTPIAGFALALLLSFCTTTMVKRAAIRLGVFDRRTKHKIHDRDIPRLGGIAIASGFFLPILALALRDNEYASGLYAQPTKVAALLGGALVVFCLGLYDDLRGATAVKKFAIQVPVAVLTWAAGIRVGAATGPFGSVLVLTPAVSLCVTVAWIVGAMNAINLIDGLDGLASGIALEALAATAVCAWHRADPVLALLAICLAGSVLGFLFHNFHPASIFMGDCGSLLLGYVLAVASIWSSQKAATVVSTILPVVVLAVPLLDTSLAVLRRVIRGQGIFTGDLDHIHHRVLGLGLSQRQSVLLLYGVGGIFCSLSVVMVYAASPRIEWSVMALSVVIALAFIVWLRRIRPGAPQEVVLVRHRNLAIRRAVFEVEQRLLRSQDESDLSEALEQFEREIREAPQCPRPPKRVRSIGR